MDSRMRFLGRTVILAGIVAVAVAFGVTATQGGASVARAADEQAPGGEPEAMAEGAATEAAATDATATEAAATEGAATDATAMEGTAAEAAATDAAAPTEGAAAPTTGGAGEDASQPAATRDGTTVPRVTTTERAAEDKGSPAGMSVGSIELLVFLALLAMLMLISYRGPKSRLSK